MCLIVVWNIYAQKKYIYDKHTHYKGKKNITHKGLHLSIWIDHNKPYDHTSISRILMTNNIQFYDIHKYYPISIVSIYWKCVDTIEYSANKWMDKRQNNQS